MRKRTEILYILIKMLCHCFQYIWTYDTYAVIFESVCGHSTYDVYLPHYVFGGPLSEIQCARQCTKWTDNPTNTGTCIGLNICDDGQGPVCEVLYRKSKNDTSRAACSDMSSKTGCTFYHLMSEVWPRGTYSLLTPTLTCPNDWDPDMIEMNMQTGGNTNYSTGNHIQQNRGDNASYDFVQLPSCDKMSEFGPYDWPAGDYCIIAAECVSGFQSGYIDLDEEDDINDSDTTWSFCCRNDGLSSVPIQLPTTAPFYLFRFVGSCQEVVDMAVTEEYIHLDTEDNYNADTFHGSVARVYIVGTEYVDMRLCYYE